MKKLIAIITLSLLLTGCGESNTNDNVKENNSNNNVVENKTTTEEKIELYSDDHKIVFKQVAGSYLVFYYEGNQITGYELYLNYEDSTTASVAYSVLKQDHSAYSNVKNVTQKGQYVIIEYDEAEYSAYSLEDVKKTYAALEQIQKNN